MSGPVSMGAIVESKDQRNPRWALSQLPVLRHWRKQ